MPIDIDSLSEAELVDLNHRIVERLRFLAQMRAHAAMLDFRIGDRVAFDPPGRPSLEGVLTRYNKKTVTVLTPDGQRWNVSPGFLRRVADSGRSPGRTTGRTADSDRSRAPGPAGQPGREGQAQLDSGRDESNVLEMWPKGSTKSGPKG